MILWHYPEEGGHQTLLLDQWILILIKSKIKDKDFGSGTLVK
jgi:hypothetical protein